MGISRRPLLLGLAIVMGLGFIVYFRLWFIDYQISADDPELLRYELSTFSFISGSYTATSDLNGIQSNPYSIIICI